MDNNKYEYYRVPYFMYLSNLIFFQVTKKEVGALTLTSAPGLACFPNLFSVIFLLSVRFAYFVNSKMYHSWPSRIENFVKQKHGTGNR